MGQLSELKLPTREVATQAGTLTVRGLSTQDIILAASEYGPQMALLFSRVEAIKDEMIRKDVTGLINSLGREVPGLMAAIIALACDDYSPATVKLAAKLPFPAQAELIEAIFHLTFHSEAEVKKLVESVARMILGVTGTLKGMQARVSDLGIGESGDE